MPHRVPSPTAGQTPTETKKISNAKPSDGAGASLSSLTSTHLRVGIAAGRARLLLDVERSLPASSADDVRLGVALSETSGTLGHGGICATDP